MADYNVPIGQFAKEFAGEALSLDSRLRVTLRSLFFRPGQVPKDYVAGQRARFVPPVRLYIFASFAMFLILSLGPGLTVNNVRVNGESADSTAAVTPTAESADTLEAPDTSAGPDASTEVATPSRGLVLDAGGVDTLSGPPRTFGQRLGRGVARMQNDREAFNREFLNLVAQAMFIVLPAFALLLKLAYRKRLYVQHLVFALYYHSFAFTVMAVSGIPNMLRLEVIADWFAALLLVLPVYLALAMKRFYGESWFRTGLKFVAVSFTYLVVTSVTWLGALTVSLLLA